MLQAPGTRSPGQPSGPGGPALPPACPLPVPPEPCGARRCADTVKGAEAVWAAQRGQRAGLRRPPRPLPGTPASSERVAAKEGGERREPGRTGRSQSPGWPLLRDAGRTRPVG